MADRFILLPRRGLRAEAGPAMEILTRIPRVRSTEPSARATLDIGNQPTVEVIDVAGETQAKLVEMDREAMEAINAPESPLRAVPVVEYDRPDPRPRPQLAAANMPAAVSRPVTFTCRDARSGAALAGVQVVAFTNFSSRAGGSGFTDAAGRVVLHLAGAVVERLFCYAPFTHWGAFRKNVSTATAIQVTHEPVDLSYTDCVRHYYGGSRFNPNLGVTVGVIDTGSGPHADLNIVGGRNTVTGEPATDFADGDIHGTHVAGLIGSRGTPPTGLRGLAPGVRLWIGRVFGANAEGASNYSILKAMIFAAAEGCDIINLSLGGGPFDPIVEEAIADARNQGMLVVVAAGNDGRRPVNFPAAYRGATAVSAMGREGTFPAGSVEEGDVSRPPSGNDAREFLAEFSNIGNEISVTGLGVGTLSTLPNNQHGPLSGTSMAAPVVAGAAACLLSRDPVVHAMARNRTRSDQIERLLLTSCVKRGFGQRFEGFGLPDPALI